MSDILAAIGFGDLPDGAETTPTTEFTNEQWSPEGASYTIYDNGDGRKWVGRGPFGVPDIGSWSWSGVTEIYVAGRFYRGYASGVSMLELLDGSTHLGNIGINSSGNVVYSNYPVSSTSSNIVATSSGTISVATWAHIEARIILHNTTGSVKIWINGVLDSDTTGIDTIASGTSCTKVRVLDASMSEDHRFGDFVIHTSSDHLGDMGVYYLPANADGVDTDFTPSAGDNYENVDEIPSDGDTTYNESDGTAGHRDSFETAGISGITPISVSSLVRARKTAGGAATLLPGIVHSGSEEQGAARTLSEDYTTFGDWVDDCPGSSGWTLTQIGNAEVSYEVGA